MRNIFVTILLILPLSIASVSNVRAEDSQNAHQKFMSAYGELLQKYLSPTDRKEGIFVTSVNYAGWSQDPLHKQAMENAKQVDHKNLSPVEDMAFWINVYNLLTVDLIVSEKEQESIRNLDGLIRNVWKIHKWELDGKKITLDDIEHEILRPMNEPRIHYAINCASLSCPDLRAEPYTSKGLFAQLEEQERKFISDPTKGVYIVFDASGSKAKEVRLSRLFKWYDDDFGGKKEIKKLIKKYKGIDMKERPNYLPYNWNLNGDW